jgi:hypothetical protein
VRAAHRLDEILVDVERDLDPARREVGAEATEEVGDRESPDDGRLVRIDVGHGIGCEQPLEEIHVAHARGRDEPVGDVLPFPPLRFDLGSCGRDGLPYAQQQTLTCVFADSDHACSLGSTPSEHVMKQKYGALDRQELLEEQEAPQRKRLRLGRVA